MRSPNEALEPGRAPEPPRGRQRRQRKPIPPLVKFLNGTLTFLLIAMLGAGVAVGLLEHAIDQPGPLSATAIAVVPKGEGLTGIAARLEKEGIVSDSRLFAASAYYLRDSSRLKAGEFEIRRQASIRQVLETLVEGKAVSSSVRIPEGLTSYQIVERLKADPNLQGDIAQIPAEGSLWPDTYKVTRGATRQKILDQMQADSRKWLEQLWAARQSGLPFASIEDALIMASIVEKETGVRSERDRVAAVFINRLRKGMRLQSDPTIIYDASQGQGSLGRGILRSEIDARTPHNTYQINGLPPTPICNPGRAAIEATLNPARTPDLYFVADGSGGHAFAPSLAEHNKNVLAWRRIEKEARAQRQAAIAAGAGQGTGAAAAETEPQQADEPAAEAPARATAAEPPAAVDIPPPVRKPRRPAAVPAAGPALTPVAR